MLIKQLYCEFGHGFKEAMADKYFLGPYTDVHAPLLMLGCYNAKQRRIALDHKGFVVICWRGQDALLLRCLRGWGELFRDRPEIKHIVSSRFIAEDLDSLEIPFYMVPVVPHKHEQIQPHPLGDCVYMYEPDNETYGSSLYKEVKKNLPELTFIEAMQSMFSREELFEQYKKCFIGLRFTMHDGLSNTVCELGLMGRRIIWNGGTINSIPFNKNNVYSIVNSIKNEYLRRHDSDYLGISKKMFDFLNIGQDFLNTEFYDQPYSSSPNMEQ